MTSARQDRLDRPVPLDRRIRYVPYPIDEWCPVLQSRSLAPGAARCTEVLGEPIVLFRDRHGAVAALEDRCPHRGIPLSLGMVVDDGLRCAYHGWVTAPSGRVCRTPVGDVGDDVPRARRRAVTEGYGLIWIFVGDVDRGLATPLPRLHPCGTGDSSDLLVTLDVNAHWSLVLENGLDLFHHHLHRDVPFFFTIHALESCTSDGTALEARYTATLRGAFNQRRNGSIVLRTERNALRLDFDGFPVIHGLATPRAADARRSTIWWLVSFPGLLLRSTRPLWVPLVRRQLLRGFRQDAAVLASEQTAFERSAAPQYEINPVIPRLHEYLEQRLIDYARRLLIEPSATVTIGRADLIAQAGRGELAVLGCRNNGELRLLAAADLDQTLSDDSVVQIVRYHHLCIVPAAPP